jgi:hypothetical protein
LRRGWRLAAASNPSICVSIPYNSIVICPFQEIACARDGQVQFTRTGATLKQTEVLRKVGAKFEQGSPEIQPGSGHTSPCMWATHLREKTILPAADYFTSEFEVQRKPPEMVRL